MLRIISVARFGAAAIAMGGVALLAHGATAPTAQSQSDLIQDGKVGFVMARISYALSDANDANAICPTGTSWGPRDIFAATPEGQRRPDESDADYTRRLGAGGNQVMTAPNGQNLCANPEAGAPDPRHPIVTGNVASHGINLDGLVSTRNGRAAPGTCAHDDFRGVNGERGVDNQFLRALGCTNTLAPGGAGNDFGGGILVGEWGELISLEDVQDLRTDNSVTVNIYASNDPVQLSPTREPLVNATYAFQRDPRYQSTTQGRIVNGVLTTDPIDVRMHWVVNNIRVDRVLNRARLRLTIAADGAMEGVMAGYTPVDAAYDYFGFRSGVDAQGQPSRGRQGSASGYAFTARHTCNGMYYALRQMADGDRDPATGNCTSVSTQYRVRFIPAFVVDAETRSQNQDLAR